MSRITVNKALVDELNAKAERDAFKAERQSLVDNIKVTVADKVYDGDEISQARMARAIVAMDDTETTLWVLADNSVYYPTKAELIEVLRLAGAEQTRVWVMPTEEPTTEEPVVDPVVIEEEVVTDGVN